MLPRERDARRWFGGCPGTDVFIEELTQRLGEEIVKSKAFGAASAAAPAAASAAAAPSCPDAPPAGAAVAETAAAEELAALVEAATAELSSALFSMPKVGGGVPDAFARLAPVDLAEEEDGDEVIVVMPAGGGGGGRSNPRTIYFCTQGP